MCDTHPDRVVLAALADALESPDPVTGWGGPYATAGQRLGIRASEVGLVEMEHFVNGPLGDAARIRRYLDNTA